MSSDDENNSLQLKITIIGEYFVGKTSIISRFVEGVFDDTYQATIGFTFLSKTVSYQGKEYTLNIWDTSGSERHRAVAPNYYRGSDGCILVYDLSNPNSLEPLNFWYEEFQNLATKSGASAIPALLIGNKSDLPYDQATFDSAQQFAEKHDIKDHYKASALSGENVNTAFDALVRLCTEHLKQQFNSIKINPVEVKKQEGCC